MPQLPKPSLNPGLFSSALCSSLNLEEFLDAFRSLKRLFKKHPKPKGRKRGFYDRLFTPWVTLWAMILQRILADHSLSEAVVHLRDGKADGLAGGKSKPLSQRIISAQTASFSDSRKRLPLSFVQEVFGRFHALLSKSAQGLDWKGWRILLLDGTNLRVRPFGDLSKIFSPHSNKKGKGYWCLLRVVGGFCLRSGLVLASAIGSQSDSEQALASRIILAMRAKTLIVGDRNFGVFRIAQVAREAKAAVLLRLTAARAKNLLGKEPLRPGLDRKVSWKLNRHAQSESGCSTEPVEGRLLVCRVQRNGHRPFDLYLFTNLLDSSVYSVPELVELYGFRWHVELNFRYLKSHMDLNFLNCKSSEMAQKEWYAGLIAYNLIRATMFVAAIKKGLDPLNLSFSGSVSTMRLALLDWAAGRQIDFQKVLDDLAKQRLPKRKKARPNEPRLIRHLGSRFGALKGDRQSARKRWKSNAKS
jgi:putative transposase